ncbi:hypothetical protein M0R45_025993 [Rubus argutus]|uniref:Uncharacterized protein n=1 Tax=Rubus argutus TaxID=59490 RepID=A0AAW1WZU8_RUBAR
MTKPRYLRAEEYLELAKQMADDLEAVGSPVDDWEFVSCILEGLPSKYDDFVASIRDRPLPLTREELCDLLISFSHTIPLDIVVKIMIICGFCCFLFFSAVSAYFIFF